MTKQPSLFISHGAPDLALADAPAHHFLRMLGKRLERPEAIVIASAHHETRGVAVRAPERFSTWHDFGNFGPRLFQLRYEPAGALQVADDVLDLLAQAGLGPRRDTDARIDHGAWVPLSLLFPKADVPIAMVSIDPGRGSEWHERIGAALAPLRQRNILIIGSGSISHNLRAIFSATPGADRQWVDDFTAWLEEAIRTGDRERILSTMRTAPSATLNHPTDEHLLPLFLAYGAGGGGAGKRLHHSFTHELLAMDVYGFGEAETLERLALEKA